MKTLIAYFSHTGENYFGGSIKNISKGNTEVVAEFAQKASGGDLFQIQTVKDYPVNYKECTEVAAAEGRAGERPALKGSLPSIADYDTIILGYPIWWGDLPMVVYTFLEKHDLSGKTILPFCTHEGSGVSGTDGKIKRLYKNASVKSALAVRGGTAQNERTKAEKAVDEWVKKSGK